MKTQIKHRLRQVSLVALLMAALVAVDGGQMGKAQAGIRVNARLDTPHVTVHYKHGPRQGRVNRPFIYRISQRDRIIARRLAYETGYRRIVLLDLRSRGLNWKQIGRRLDMRNETVDRVVETVDARLAANRAG